MKMNNNASVLEKLNLNGNILKVAVNHVPPFCTIFRQNGQIVPGFSIEIELVKFLEFKFGFQSQLIDANQTWGFLKRDGTWNGVIGFIANGTADFGMCSLTQTLQRSQVVDFSHFTVMDEMVFLSHQPGLQSRVWMIAKPFTPIIWLANLISYLVVIGSLYWLYHFQRKMSHRSSSRFIIMKVFSVAVNQSSSFAWREKSSIRFIYAVWMLTVLVLTTSYSGTFYSHLTLPVREPPIDTVADLVRVASQDSHFLIMGESGSYLSFFIHASPQSETAFVIGRHINRTKKAMPKSVIESISMFERDSGIILMDSRINFIYRSVAYPHSPWYIGSEALGQDYMGLAFPKHSPLYHPFNSLIQQIFERGFLAHWAQKMVDIASIQNRAVMIQSESTNDQHRVEQLQLKDLSSVFLLWYLGILVAWISFVGEHFLVNTKRALR